MASAVVITVARQMAMIIYDLGLLELLLLLLLPVVLLLLLLKLLLL